MEGTAGSVTPASGDGNCFSEAGGQWEPGGMAGGSNSVSVTYDNSMPPNSQLQGQTQT